MTIIAIILLAAFDSQFFFIIRAHKYSCRFIRVSERYTMTLNRIDAVIYSLGPFAIIGLLNVAIIYKFVKAKLESEYSSSTESTKQALSKTAMRSTAILITVSITFILLTGPANLTFSITSYPHPIVSLVIYLCACTNHSINAVLYCIVGSRFRQEVTKTLRCRRANNHQNNVNSHINSVPAKTSTANIK